MQKSTASIFFREEGRHEFSLLAHHERYGQNPALAKLQHRIQIRFEGVLAFLGRPDIPFHNNAAERDIRPIALHRKMTGGCRSPAGANALGHWMTVTQTLKKQVTVHGIIFLDALGVMRFGQK